jgi:hypothetical protein
MKESFEVHVQIDGHEPQAITVQDDETIASLLARLRGQLPGIDHEPELFAVFADDDENELHRDHKFCECRPHRPKVLHCHRCKKVAVTVFYNGSEKREFNPNAKIRRVAQWAMKQFQVDGNRKWVLRQGSSEGEILDQDTTLGKLVKFPDCALSLYLTERCMIQG